MEFCLYAMLVRALKLQKPMETFAFKHDQDLPQIEKKTRCFNLNSHPDLWDRLSKVKEYLGKFQEVTVIMEGDTFPTVSLVVPQYNRLMKHIETQMLKTKPDDTGVTVDVIHTASIASLEKIKKYYNKSSI